MADIEQGPPGPDAHPHFAQAADENHNFKAIGVGVAALVIFCLGTLWGWLIMREKSGSNIPDTSLLPAPEAPLPVAGMVYHYTFSSKVSWPPLNREKAQQLETYGWADRTKKRIHLPIEQAMEMYLQSQSQGQNK